MSWNCHRNENDSLMSLTAANIVWRSKCFFWIQFLLYCNFHPVLYVGRFRVWWHRLDMLSILCNNYELIKNCFPLVVQKLKILKNAIFLTSPSKNTQICLYIKLLIAGTVGWAGSHSEFNSFCHPDHLYIITFYLSLLVLGIAKNR